MRNEENKLVLPTIDELEAYDQDDMRQYLNTQGKQRVGRLDKWFNRK